MNTENFFVEENNVLIVNKSAEKYNIEKIFD